MKEINSRSNELIKHVSSLQQKRARNRHRQFVGEGARVCQTLIQHCTLINLFVTKAQLHKALDIAPKEKLLLVPDHVMEKISSATTASGIVGQFAMPQPPSPNQLGPGFVLAKISDPGNMGTLIRTAAALGKKSIVLIDGTDPYAPKAIQASAGTIGSLALFEWSWQELLAQKNKLSLAAMIVSGGEKPSEVSPESLLVVGSEAHGIPQEWVADCDVALTLPMPGGTESLNAAVAGSIALYLIASK